MKLKKGDEVIVLAGKYLGKHGVISRVMPGADKVIVDGVNISKRHTKPRGQVMQGGIIDKEMPIHVSNIALWCSSCKAGRRIGFEFNTDGSKRRVCRKCGSDI